MVIFVFGERKRVSSSGHDNRSKASSGNKRHPQCCAVGLSTVATSLVTKPCSSVPLCGRLLQETIDYLYHLILSLPSSSKDIRDKWDKNIHLHLHSSLQRKSRPSCMQTLHRYTWDRTLDFLSLYVYTVFTIYSIYKCFFSYFSFCLFIIYISFSLSPFSLFLSPSIYLSSIHQFIFMLMFKCR